MKKSIEKREPSSLKDFVALALTTFGVGYLPLAPGTWGSLVGVLIYLGIGLLNSVWDHHWSAIHGFTPEQATSIFHAFVSVLFLLFCLAGVLAAGRSTDLLGSSDPPQAVVDEVMGQLVTYLFIPFTSSWKFVAAGFLLFRLFDIWKPYPIAALENLPAGLGVCADDIVAGVYAGICLSAGYAIALAI